MLKQYVHGHMNRCTICLNNSIITWDPFEDDVFLSEMSYCEKKTKRSVE